MTRYTGMFPLETTWGLQDAARWSMIFSSRAELVRT